MRRVLVIAVAMLAWCVPPALADGDPASDTLVSGGLDVAFPYEPTEATVRDALYEAVDDANEVSDKRLKIAIIAAASDLGSVGALFDKPQQYADFLTSEISSVYPGVVVVVMPKGLGANGGKDLTPKQAQDLIKGIVPKADSTVELAKAAMPVAQRFAERYPDPNPPRRSAGRKERTKSTPEFLAGLGGVIVLTAGLTAFITVHARRRTARPQPPPDGDPDDGV